MMIPATSPAVEAAGFRRTFAPGRLSLGVFFPIEAFSGDQPAMGGQEALAVRAEALGFAALWVRDVPLRVPGFGDVGQVYDPWVWLGAILARTRSIALATGAIVLPLRHPLHTAKAAASVDRLSGGRLLLGVASGDRPEEFPAFGRSLEARGDEFRENLRVLRRAWEDSFPRIDSFYGHLEGADPVPKPLHRGVPVLVTGQSRQTLSWIAREADGWITYPRPLERQADAARLWRSAVHEAAPGAFKPMAQSLYIDLSERPDEPASPIHLGWRVGRVGLRERLHDLRKAGVNHVALNLKYGSRPAAEVLEELGEHVLPDFPAANGERDASRETPEPRIR
jgi:luciferase-type oxidoreductase